jgi:hypothetical protein
VGEFSTGGRGEYTMTNGWEGAGVPGGGGRGGDALLHVYMLSIKKKIKYL